MLTKPGRRKGLDIAVEDLFENSFHFSDFFFLLEPGFQVFRAMDLAASEMSFTFKDHYAINTGCLILVLATSECYH